MSLASVEQYLVDTVKARFGARLRAVESLPADWDAKTFERILRLAPGVFVVFSGGPAQNQAAEIRGEWVLLSVTTHASGELARRRGDSREIGAYEIVETTVPLLHDHPVPDVGLLRFEGVENLFTDALEEQGATIYGMRFSLPMELTAPTPGAPDPLDVFATFHAATDLAPADGTAEAADTVTLPQ